MVDGARQPGSIENSRVPAAPTEPEDKYGWAWIPGLMLVVLIIFIVVAAKTAPTSNEGFLSGAAALTIIGGVAVGIERFLEVIWGMVDNSKGGGWWPLVAVRKRILQVEERTKVLLSVPTEAVIDALDRASRTLTSAGQMTDTLTDKIAEYKDTATQRLPQLAKKVEDAAKLAPGSPRLAIIREAKNEALDLYDGVLAITGRVDNLATDVRATVTAAAAQTERLEDVIESFSDNPARKIMSVLAGATIGVIIAGFVGLNLFLAVEESEAAGDQVQQNADSGAQLAQAVAPDNGSSPLHGRTGIVLTGIITGLGASPTHEVIKAVQRRKERNTVGAVNSRGAGQDIDAATLGIMGGYAGWVAEQPSSLARTYQRHRAIRPTG